ncbi:bromodomain adjacent to zinc finger domain protein 1A-like isoform X2 [Ptychodera flava]|uniref:bromodomain adjacent to zinc finger domain protein 1A-like isoform X2 n=1 Tax=Ptychodera flava TaxID=63121 RepID=UPI003969D57E
MAMLLPVETCRVLKVIPPDSHLSNGVDEPIDLTGEDKTDSDDDVVIINYVNVNDKIKNSPSSSKPTKSSNNCTATVDPDAYRYQVIPIEGVGKPLLVSASDVSRKKGLYTREKNKLFVKQHSEIVKEFWRVKPKFVRRYQLDNRNLSDFFAGPLPNFANSPTKKIKKNKLISQEKVEKKKKKKQKEEGEEKKKKKKKEGKENVEKVKLTPEERAALREKLIMERAAMKAAEKEEKAKERSAIREKLAVEKAEMREKLRKEKEEEKIKKKLEREVEKEKRKEERRAREEHLKEWSKIRDDLECDDLKELPTPTPVQTKLPNELFGDVMMALEFLHVFADLLGTKDEFPEGIGLEYIERALSDVEIDGPLFELYKFLLSAIFTMQQEEEEDEKIDLKEQGVDLATTTDLIETLDEDMDPTYNAVTAAATVAAAWPQLHQGTTMRQLPIDAYTISEVLRLHFLASGAKTSTADAKYRYQQRGGYTPLDDAGLEFRMHEAGILRSLTTGNIYDLTTAEKLKIVTALCGQLMTYVTCRDFIEDNFDKWRACRKEWKENQASEQKREREEASARYKQRQEERAREKEKEKERKLQKQKEKEERLRKEEQEKGSKVGEKSTDEASKAKEDSPKRKNEKEDSDEEEEGKPRRKSRRTEKENEQEDERMETEESQETGDKEGASQEEKMELKRKQREEEAKKKEEFHKKDRELYEQMVEMCSKYSLTPLGVDRIYRRFWRFRSIPGLFVEYDMEYLDKSDLEPVPQNFASNPFLPYNSTQGKKSGADGSKADESIDCDTSTASNKENVDNDEGEQADTSNSRETKTILNEKNGASQSVKTESAEQTDTKIDFENYDPCMLKRDHCTWAFYKTKEEIDRLTNTLNPRGYRESALKEALLQDKQGLCYSIEECPVDLLYQMKSEAESADSKPDKPKQVMVKLGGKKTGLVSEGHEDSSPGSESLELTLREQLLDMEERIYTGSLGYLKAEDRILWIKAIENGSYDMQCKELTWGPWWQRHKLDDKDFTNEAMEMSINDVSMGEEQQTLPIKHKDRVSELKRSETPLGSSSGSTRCSTPNPVDQVVRDLACALLQIAQGIEPKYLKPPLGEDEAAKKAKQKASQEAAMKEFQAMMAASKKKKKNEKKRKDDSDGESSDDESSSDEETEPSKPEKTVYERWEESLMSSTSLPQLFLHMATLEASIMWSKSILNARCRICRRKGDAEHMLLCDGCDRGHHMYCLKPQVKVIPPGDWFCYDCRPKQARQSQRRRRKSVLEESESEESEEESESDEESESESEESEQEDDSDVEDEEDESDSGASLLSSEEESDSDSEDSHSDECAKCGKAGQLILCDNCPLAYHLRCTDPPLKKIPSGKWVCEVCTEQAKKKPGIKVKGPSKSKSGRSTPSSVSSTSKQKRQSLEKPSTSKSKTSRQAADSDNSFEETKASPRGSTRSGRNISKPKSAEKPNSQSNDRQSRSSDKPTRGGDKATKSNERPSRSCERPSRSSKRSKSQTASDGSPSPPRSRSDAKKARRRDSSEDSGTSGPARPKTASSSRGSEWARQMKLCEQLIGELIKHKDAWPFLQPVSKKMAPDYHKLIKRPMDLGTMKMKMNQLDYNNPAEIIADARLLFTNCEQYNQPSSQEYKAGSRLSTFLEKKMKELAINIKVTNKSAIEERKSKRKTF